MSEWANQLQIGYKTLQGRIDNSGWSIKKAIETSLNEKVRDLTECDFGRLKVISLAYVKKHSYWNCICECGNKKIVAGTNLTGGYTLSCGCLQKETASAILKNRDFSKPILQYDMNGILMNQYNSPIDASQKTGISKANIISVANQKEYKPGKIRKQAGGYIWKYKNAK